MTRDYLQCEFCGISSSRVAPHGRQTYCTSESACFNRIVAQLRHSRVVIRRLIDAGNPMSNACFNLSQPLWGLNEHNRSVLKDMHAKWDSVRALARSAQ